MKNKFTKPEVQFLTFICNETYDADSNWLSSNHTNVKNLPFGGADLGTPDQ